MKLLFCLSCESVFNVSSCEKKTCPCGKTFGRICDYGGVICFEGPGIPIRFHWKQFCDAANGRQSNREDKPFDAFVIGLADRRTIDDNLRPPYTDKKQDEIFFKKILSMVQMKQI